MKILLPLLFLALAYSKDDPGNQGELTPQELKEINYLVVGMRGFWTGFERSLFQDESLALSQLCFDD